MNDINLVVAGNPEINLTVDSGNDINLSTFSYDMSLSFEESPNIDLTVVDSDPINLTAGIDESDINVSIEHGVSRFINLADTPSAYISQAGKAVVVNQAENGLEFSTIVTDVYWEDVLNKPSTFPPSAHAHSEADIVDLDKYTQTQVNTLLSGKANTSHTHAVSDITDFPTNVSYFSNDSGYLTSFQETDPIFSAWDKSTGISITESQISDFGTYSTDIHTNFSDLQNVSGTNTGDQSASDFDIKDLADTTNLRASWSAKWDYDENTIKAVKVDSAGDADTVNGLTVETAVPANAVFTDTTYASGDFNLSDLNDVISTDKATGKILKVDSIGNHIYVEDEGGTDEKVKINEDDQLAGYLEDKIIAGSGISIVEGTGDGEGTLIISNTDKGSDIDLSGYAQTSNLNISNWDTAYGWGNHAGLYDTVGTASSVVGTHESTYDHTLIGTALQSESDPVFGAHAASSITSTDIVNLANLSGTNTGDQDLSAYLTSETDPIFTASAAADITSTDIINLSNLSGTNTGDQDLSGYVQGTKVTSIGTPGLDTNIPTEKAVRAALSAGGYGDVSGPASAVNNNVVFFDGNTGKLIKDSGLTLSGTNTGDQVLPTRDSLGLDTDDTVTFANLSGNNTGDQDLSSYVVGPSSSSNNNVPQFNGETGKILKNGFPVVTSIGVPGLDTNLVTEKAVRDAIVSGGGALSALSDVSIATPLNKQILVYSTSESKWINEDGSALAAAGGNSGQVQFNNANVLSGMSRTKWNEALYRLGLNLTGANNPEQHLHVNGKVKIGDDANTPTAGTMRWSGTNFEGYDGSSWKTLDVQSTSAGGWTEDSPNEIVYLSNSDRNVGIGTDDPLTKLDVVGNAYVRNSLKIGVNVSPNATASQALHVVGKIQISNDAKAATAGTIRYLNGIFEGYDGSQWKALDVQSTSGGGWTEDDTNNLIYTSNLGRRVAVGAPASDYKFYVEGDMRVSSHSWIQGRTYFSNTGTGVPSGSQRVEINGKLRVGDDAITPTSGTIRYYNGSFEGYNGTNWKALDALPEAAAGGWTNIDNNVYLTTGANNVGLGTSTPSQKLDVIGNQYVSGRIGIKTTSPTTELDVNGWIKLGNRSGTPAAGFVRWTGTNFQGYNGTQWINLDNQSSESGEGGWIDDGFNNVLYTAEIGRNVGIGTFYPTKKLDVVGTGQFSDFVNLKKGLTFEATAKPVTPAYGTMIIDQDDNRVKWYDGSSWSDVTISSFLSLTDTPENYNSAGGRVVAVKQDASGLEFVSSGAIGTDQQVKITADDTTEGYLNTKLLTGTGITKTINNPEGNETLTISVTPNTYAELSGANFTGNVRLNSNFNMLNHNNYTYLSENAIFNGTSWNRININEPAIKVSFLTDNVGNAYMAVLTTPSGSNPITTWTQQLQINELGNLLVSGNISANNLTGTNTGDQDLSGYIAGTKVTSIASPGTDSNIPTEKAVRDALSAIGGGDVFGPATSTNNNVALFDGTNSKTIKDSGVAISDVVVTSNLTSYAQLSGATFTGSISATNLSGTNTGDQTITLTGDVTGTGTGSFATTIANNAVTETKINNSAVTYAKIQNVSAHNRILGRYTTGAGAIEEIVLGSNLSLSGNTLNAEGGAGTATWGGISGTLSNQTDLHTRLEAIKKDTITFGFIGNTEGVKQYAVASYPFTIKSWRIVSSNSGSVVVDVWKASGSKPTSASQSIAGSEKPTLSGQDLNSDTNLTTWTTSVSTGDVLAFNIDSISAVNSFTLTMEIEK